VVLHLATLEKRTVGVVLLIIGILLLFLDIFTELMSATIVHQTDATLTCLMK